MPYVHMVIAGAIGAIVASLACVLVGVVGGLTREGERRARVADRRRRCRGDLAAAAAIDRAAKRRYAIDVAVARLRAERQER